MDYTAERVPKGKRAVVVRSYMALHQGMSLVALTNAILDEPMPRRFHADPMVKAAELLLQERIPRDAPLSGRRSRPAPRPPSIARGPLMSRRLTTANTPRRGLTCSRIHNIM